MGGVNSGQIKEEVKGYIKVKVTQIWSKYKDANLN